MDTYRVLSNVNDGVVLRTGITSLDDAVRSALDFKEKHPEYDFTVQTDPRYVWSTKTYADRVRAQKGEMA